MGNSGINKGKRIELAAAHLSAIVESSDDAIISKDLRGFVTSWNSGAERLFGYTASEMLGQSILRLIPTERQQEETEILGRIQRGERVKHFDTQRLRKDGSLVDISVTVSPIRDATGKIVGASKVARDMTTQKLAEHALRQSEERMRLATEATSVGIWEWNVLTNQIHWDAQMFRMYGIAPTTDGFILYNTWSESVLPEDLRQQELILQDTVQRRGRSFREFRIRRADNREVRHIHAVETVRLTAGGETELVVGTNLDITERKQREDEIRQLNHDLEQRVRERTEDLANTLSMQQAILSSANYAIISVTPEGVVTTFNSAAERWLG